MHMVGPGPLVKQGDRVTNQTLLGGVGSTGRSSGNHLHYEVIIGGKKENPALYLGRPRGG
jgi:murein DD-endopeptidase MepM/ murein hydrolase activator NlpD